MGIVFAFTFVTMVGGNPQHDAYGFRYWKNPVSPFFAIYDVAPLRQPAPLRLFFAMRRFFAMRLSLPRDLSISYLLPKRLS